MRGETSSLGRTSVWFVFSGVLVTLRAAIELADPVYWEPSSFLDYSAAILTTVAWVVTGVALLSWWQSSPIRRGRLLLLIGGIGTAVSGVGNLLEDVFDVEFGELLFTLGGMVGAISILMGAVLVLTVKDSLRWTGLFLLAFIAGGFFPDDGGEFLSGASLGGLGLWLMLSARDAERSTADART